MSLVEASSMGQFKVPLPDPPLRPLVTFAVFAYNQERFIEAALAGALAQTYRPLEIVVSDDASTDRTFEIVERIAAGYSGPHRLVLNRNPENLGIGGNVNRVMELATGSLIVGAAGDDVSMPARVATNVRAWEQHGRCSGSIYSDVIIVDEAGRSQGAKTFPLEKDIGFEKFAAQGAPGVMGCCHGWTRDVFDRFGPMLPGTVYEDRVIPFRSFLIGKIIHIPEPLVEYRIHQNNQTGYKRGTSDEEILEALFATHQRFARVFENYLSDFQRVEFPDGDAALASARMNVLRRELARHALFADLRKARKAQLLARVVRGIGGGATIKDVIKAGLLTFAPSWWAAYLRRATA